ncbi:MAG: LptA/OstA family protein [Cyanobacteria bacterium P01_G01_bin.54]
MQWQQYRRGAAIALLSSALLGLGPILHRQILQGQILPNAQAQVADGRAMTIRSDRQEADQVRGVVTATGNVRIDYPARQMQATSAQAQYFSQEQRVRLTGNVYVLQAGNSIRAEIVDYFIAEGRAVAIPPDSRQVESIYILSDPDAPPTTPPAEQGPVYNPKPAFKEAQSDTPRPLPSTDAAPLPEGLPPLNE